MSSLFVLHHYSNYLDVLFEPLWLAKTIISKEWKFYHWLNVRFTLPPAVKLTNDNPVLGTDFDPTLLRANINFIKLDMEKKVFRST